ncbi:MAG: hypothetical protein ACYTEU_14320 [Planctomycetota bacterium]|jgi:hypothetical protein
MKALSLAILILVAAAYFGNASTAIAVEGTAPAAVENSSKEVPVGANFRFVPSRRQVGDTMPFYWNGEYHVYYLMNPTGNYQINWEHIVSKDLVH